MIRLDRLQMFAGSCEHVKGTDRVIAYGPAAGFPERRGVGSCATLVAEMYFNTAPELLKMDPSIGYVSLHTVATLESEGGFVWHHHVCTGMVPWDAGLSCLVQFSSTPRI